MVKVANQTVEEDDDGPDDAATYPVPPARAQIFAQNARNVGLHPAPGLSVLGGQQQGQQQAAAAPPLSNMQSAFTGNYALLYQMAQQDAQAKQQAQQAYLDNLQKQEGALSQAGMSDLDKAALWAQVAGAFGAPTRTGGFTETLGNVGTALSGPLTKQAEAQRQRQQQLQQLQLARQKLAMEMAGSGQPSVSDIMQMMKAQQDAQPKPGETERLLQDPSLSPEDRKKALRAKLGIEDEDTEELKDITLPDQSKITVVRRGGKSYDPVTNEELDPAKLSALQGASDMADRKAQAQANGIPLPERDMLANIKNPKIRAAQQAKMMDEARKVLTTEEVKSPSSSIMEDMREAQRFLDINQKHQAQSGPFVGKVPAMTQPAEEMDKISIGLSRKLRQPGEGTMSNFDAQQFGKAFMSRNNDYNVNLNIGKGFIATKQLELERREFFNQYAEQNGTIQGAQAQWNKYLEANPVFDREGSKGKSVVLNPNRMGWQDYFRKEMSPKTFVRDPQTGQLVLQ